LSYFQTDFLSRLALGITHIFDDLPHAKALEIKQILYNHFKRNMYYRIRSKQRPIRPEEQVYIYQVFRKNGIKKEPQFDEYFEQYDR